MLLCFCAGIHCSSKVVLLRVRVLLYRVYGFAIVHATAVSNRNIPPTAARTVWYVLVCDRGLDFQFRTMN